MFGARLPVKPTQNSTYLSPMHRQKCGIYFWRAEVVFFWVQASHLPLQVTRNLEGLRGRSATKFPFRSPGTARSRYSKIKCPHFRRRENSLASIHTTASICAVRTVLHIFLSISSIISPCSGHLAVYTELRLLPLAHSAPMA
jgi:hypothetical protein